MRKIENNISYFANSLSDLLTYLCIIKLKQKTYETH